MGDLEEPMPPKLHSAPGAMNGSVTQNIRHQARFHAPLDLQLLLAFALAQPFGRI